MRVQNFEPTARTEVKEAPAWLDRFLDPLYKQIDNLTLMAQARISFGDNINAEFLSAKVFHDQDVDIGLQTTKGKPLGVLPMKLITGNVDAMSVQYDFTWKILDEKTIRVRVRFAAGTTITSATLTMLAVGG